MQIFIYCIEKSSAFKNEIKEYIKMSSKWANIKEINKFTPQIAKAQNSSKSLARKSYSESFLPHLNGFCVGLDENANQLDSFKFAQLLNNRAQISFFIGGAYGLEEDFKSKANLLLSLSKLTLAHKIAKLMLFEQIFRGLCINANHPYHK